MKKVCELCKSTARIYCESDEASLCWDCDLKVHSANFLVARHSRNLLCHVCQSPTPWSAAGEKLGRTISVCERCVNGCVGREESQGGNDDEIDSDEDDGESAGDVDEDGDNQVVPWSDKSPPPAVSSSSSEESSSRFRSGDGDIVLKRLRENSLDLCSEDDLECTSSPKNIILPSAAAAAGCTGAAGAVVDSLTSRPLKIQRTESTTSPRVVRGPTRARSEAIVLRMNNRFGRSSGEPVDCDLDLD